MVICLATLAARCRWGIVIGIALTIPIAVIGLVIGLDRALVVNISHTVNIVSGLIWGVMVSIWLFKVLLNKRFGSFQIVVLP